MTGLNLWRQNPGSLLDSWDTWTKEMDRLLTGADRRGGTARLPACDISETDRAYMVEFDLPGFKPEEIDIHIEGNQLVVSATRKREDEVKEQNFHRLERYYGEFRRVLALPENTNGDEIEADYSQGVLTLALPKTAAEQPKKIKVGGKSGGLLKSLLGDKKKDVKTSNV